MKQRIAVALLVFAVAVRGTAQITLINMVPQSRSGETNQDAEPSITVNPANPLQIAGSAFTWDNLTGSPMVGAAAPIYFSTDGGQTWSLALNVPSSMGSTYPTGDINFRFAASPSGTTTHLYTGILGAPSFNMFVLRSDDYRTNTIMTQLDTRTNKVDQPHVTAITSLRNDPGNDHVYVGFNNGCCGVSPTGRTASVDWTLNGGLAAPPFTLTAVEQRSTGVTQQDGYATVPTVHPDGTVYVAFYGWRSWGPGGMGGGQVNSDVVVVRDDHNGADGFASLMSGGFAGVQVVVNQLMFWTGSMGNQRLGASNMAICVDPNNSSRVYLAWADQPPMTANQTLHVRVSTDRGANWGAGDLLTVSNAISPALAVNSHGTVGFLYQQLVSSNWRTVLRRTTDAAGTVFDAGVMLSNTISSTPAPVYQPYLGDYIHMMAHNRDFYGVFSASNYPDTANFLPGVQYQRYVNWGTHQLFSDAAMSIVVNRSIDPFFFHSVELAPSDDYYVRDWTDSATLGDEGAEPSTHPAFYTSSDVWNRRGTLTGEPFMNDQPANEDAGNGMGNIGDNWAFARIRRNASLDAGSVTAHFVVSPLGTGSNFADDSTVPGLDMSAPDPPAVSFAIGDAGPKITDPYHWHLDPVASTHLCLGVQIDSANDHPLDPPLVGHAPGWGTGTDLLVINDNNKAQRNMGLSTTPARGVGGIVGGFALIHNAANFIRDLTLRSDAQNPFGDQARIRIVVGPATHYAPGQTITLPKMRPGESRWIEVTLPADPLKEGEHRAVNFYELKDDRVVNGFALGIRGGSMDRVMRDALTSEASVFSRLAALYGSDAAKKLGTNARRRLQTRLDEPVFVAFQKSAGSLIARSASDLDKAAGGDDPFGTGMLVDALSRSVRTGDAARVALDLTTLTNALDSRITMIELAKGNTADIPQTVRWQSEVFIRKDFSKLPCASQLAEDARRLSAAFDARNASWRDYPGFVTSSRDCLASAAKVAGVDIQSDLDLMNKHPNDAVRLQHAHSEILRKVAGK